MATMTLEQMMARSDAAARAAEECWREGLTQDALAYEAEARDWADACSPLLNPKES